MFGTLGFIAIIAIIIFIYHKVDKRYRQLRDDVQRAEVEGYKAKFKAELLQRRIDVNNRNPYVSIESQLGLATGIYDIEPIYEQIPLGNFLFFTIFITNLYFKFFTRTKSLNNFFLFSYLKSLYILSISTREFLNIFCFLFVLYFHDFSVAFLNLEFHISS